MQSPSYSEKAHHNHTSAPWSNTPYAADRTSSGTGHTLVPHSPGPQPAAIHELPAHNEPKREESLRSLMVDHRIDDSSGHATDIEADEAEEAQIGMARIVRVGVKRV